MTQRKQITTPENTEANSSKKKFIWLFGENLGNTMNNNSWYSFIEIVNDPDFVDIDIYYIAKKTHDNIQCAKSLPKNVYKQIIWRNSKKHKKLYRRADMFFVTLSYCDILPDTYGRNNKHPKPTIYLQHGVTAIKRLGYKADTYKNSLFKFICYSKKEAALLQENNGFKKYQTLICPAMPRWKGLINLNDKYKAHNSQNHVFWFITWRDYMNNDYSSISNFISRIKKVVTDAKLVDWINKNSGHITICLHHLFETSQTKHVLNEISELNHCTVKLQNTTNVMDEIAKSSLVITDYSSIGFDATMLDKPVILYQADRTRYLMGRKLYIDIYKDMPDAAFTPDELVSKLISPKKKVNPFFKSRLEAIDKKKILDGTYTKELMCEIAKSTRSKITFIGYNFYGTGGTVSATKALAEGLMEQGYIVDLLSLKKTRVGSPTPPGVVIRNLYHGGKSMSSRVKRIVKLKKHLASLQLDINSAHLIPYIGIALRRYLAITNSATVVSTRETLHPFLIQADNPNIRNKVYYFHTDPSIINEYYPGIMSILKQSELENVAFTTQQSMEDYKKIFGFDNYHKFAITGNSLQSSQMLSPDEVAATDLKPSTNTTSSDEIICGVSLIRMSIDRKKDIDRIIQFGKFLKSKNADDVTIDVYGQGDYCDEFIDNIDKNGIGQYIRYAGATNNPYSVIRKNDFVVDFAKSHSFGMSYIEAILNGKICFATKNNGSNDVLAGMPECIYSSWSDLLNKIRSVPKMTPEQTYLRYKSINKRYGRQAVVDQFRKLIQAQEIHSDETK